MILHSSLTNGGLIYNICFFFHIELLLFFYSIIETVYLEDMITTSFPYGNRVLLARA